MVMERRLKMIMMIAEGILIGVTTETGIAGIEKGKGKGKEIEETGIVL
jgi:hypothetical protein